MIRPDVDSDSQYTFQSIVDHSLSELADPSHSDFYVIPRDVPPELLEKNVLSAGHIALRGDFDPVDAASPDKSDKVETITILRSADQ